MIIPIHDGNNANKDGMEWPHEGGARGIVSFRLTNRLPPIIPEDRVQIPMSDRVFDETHTEINDTLNLVPILPRKNPSPVSFRFNVFVYSEGVALSLFLDLS